MKQRKILKLLFLLLTIQFVNSNYAQELSRMEETCQLINEQLSIDPSNNIFDFFNITEICPDPIAIKKSGTVDVLPTLMMSLNQLYNNNIKTYVLFPEPDLQFDENFAWQVFDCINESYDIDILLVADLTFDARNDYLTPTEEAFTLIAKDRYYQEIENLDNIVSETISDENTTLNKRNSYTADIIDAIDAKSKVFFSLSIDELNQLTPVQDLFYSLRFLSPAGRPIKFIAQNFPAPLYFAQNSGDYQTSTGGNIHLQAGVLLKLTLASNGRVYIPCFSNNNFFKGYYPQDLGNQPFDVNELYNEDYSFDVNIPYSVQIGSNVIDQCYVEPTEYAAGPIATSLQYIDVECGLLFQEYIDDTDHPFKESTILHNAIVANPCLLKGDPTLHFPAYIPPAESELATIAAIAMGAPLIVCMAAEILPIYLESFVEQLIAKGIETGIKAGISMAIDAALQATINYVFILEGDEKSLENAMKGIDPWQVGLAGLEAAIPTQQIELLSGCLGDAVLASKEGLDMATLGCIKGIVTTLITGKLFKGAGVAFKKLKQLAGSASGRNRLRAGFAELGIADENGKYDDLVNWLSGHNLFNKTWLKNAYGFIDDDLADKLLAVPNIEAFIRNGLLDKLTSAQMQKNFLLDLVGNSGLQKRLADIDAPAMRAYKKMFSHPHLRLDADFLKSYGKALDDPGMTGPPINIETTIKTWLEKSHLKCKTCPTGSLPYIDEVLNNLQDFKVHIINEVEGADKVLKQLSSGTKFATGANWVMKFTNENIPNPTSFESFITDGEKYTVDILADGIYYECKSWSGNLLAKANLTSQLTNYLHNQDITSLDQFGFYFDPEKWVPNEVKLRKALELKKDLFKASYWEKYRQLFDFDEDDIDFGDIDGLIKHISTKYFNQIIIKG